ncbi:ribosomal protein S6 kinase beta [Paragonimus westermani]|uniref:Ribosomal protein S6 kinase beta n=1 Tax=Paragonimus westermani TaxID=34504 RepID=A0A5J4P159_9TREM|nr:ribosomal protein S6 kinase beta [Paragonimus westermani]
MTQIQWKIVQKSPTVILKMLRTLTTEATSVMKTFVQILRTVLSNEKSFLNDFFKMLVAGKRWRYAKKPSIRIIALMLRTSKSRGLLAKVFLVQKVDGVDKGKLYAMKVLKKARLICNEKDKAHTVSERNILQMLRHPFLVKLHYAFQNHSNLYIVLEYCPGGELFNYLEKEGALLENAAWAPEIIKCEGHGKAVDWWSLGTLLFDMLSGGILTAPLKFPPAFSPEVISLLRGLLKRDPKERLGSKEDVEEIKRHKFFRRHEINWSDVFNRRLRPPFRPKLISDNDVSMFDPNFTRLQPIVSPADIGRSIPPDMFQGFSYVAPSVCEDSTREPWVDNHAETRRRQYGNRGALSAGRLRRQCGNLDVWTGRPSDLCQLRPLTQGHPIPHTGSSSQIQEDRVGARDLPRPKSTVPVSNVSAIGQLNPHAISIPTQPNNELTPVGFGVTMTVSTSTLNPTLGTCLVPSKANHNYENTGTMDTDIQEAEGEEDGPMDDEDDEEEFEEENVPGAKHIHGAPESATVYYNRPSENALPASHISKVPSTDRIILAADRGMNTGLGRPAHNMIASAPRKPALVSAQTQAVHFPASRSTGTTLQRRTNGAIISSLPSSTVTSAAMVHPPSGPTNSKCSVM